MAGAVQEWTGPREQYRSLEGALGAAYRTSGASGGRRCCVFVVRAGFVLVTEGLEAPAGAELIATVGAVGAPLGKLRAR
jgi:hypothetical protein